MTRRDLVLVIVLVAAAHVEAGLQTRRVEDRLAFEVASIKRNTSANAPVSISTPPGRYIATNVPLLLLINSAYRLATYQYVGLPTWSDRFDIAAKAPDGAAPDQIPLMLQTLLADRFTMVAHRESRDSPIYALVLARSDRKLGPKLSKSTMDCAPILEERQAAARARGVGPVPVPRLSPGERPICSARMMGRPTTTGAAIGLYTAGNTTMPKLADFLSAYVGRKIVDRTNLDGEFDLELEFSPQQALPPTVAAPIDDAPSVFAALQEQLGLKLESTRGPVEYLVIDSIAKPTDD